MVLLNFISHPVITSMLKMLMLFWVLLTLTKLKLSAHRQTVIWRTGIVLLMLLPWLHYMFPVISIPILPSQMNTEVQSAIEPYASQYNLTEQTTTQWQIGWIKVLIFSLSSISLMLLIRLMNHLNQLQNITDKAIPINNSKWLSQARTLANKLELQQLPLIVQSKQVNSPSTWGYFKPVILLPMMVTDGDDQINEDLELILMHEMGHIKRRDWMWLMVANITTAVFWFNPLLWLIKSKLITSIEHACDELVLEQSIQPSRYVETLLQFQGQPQKQQFNLTTGMAQPSAMFIRLQHILSPQNRSQTMHIRKQSIIMLTGFITVSLITVSQLTMAHQSPVDPVIVTPNSQAIQPSQPPQVAPHSSQLVSPPQPALHSLTPVHPTRPIASVQTHDVSVHPEAVAPHRHAQTVTPSQPIRPTTPHVDHSTAEKEAEQKLKSAEAKIRELEARLKQKENQLEQNLSKQSSVNSQVLRRQQEVKIQALKRVESQMKQLEAGLLEKQERLEIDEHQIKVQAAKLHVQAQQLQDQANELSSRIQGQQNNQQQ